MKPNRTPWQGAFIAPAHLAEAARRGELVDRFGRRISYLRLSVTDRCDLRCRYCMSEDMVFLPRNEVMSLEECLRLARVFVGLGVSKLRITGGEPLVRRDIVWLLSQLKALPGLRELTLTTNGSLLSDYAVALKKAGVDRLNISLDSLKPERFAAITRTGKLSRTLEGIEAARQVGFPIRLNVVMLRHVNDDEYVDLVRFAVQHNLSITFIEEMPLGDVHGRQMELFTCDEALSLLQKAFPLEASDESSGGPARYWRIRGQSSRVGFIAPHSHNFCGDCNRVRVTAKGELYPCLGQNDAIDLLPLLRRHPGVDEPVAAAIIDGMGIKASGHQFDQPTAATQVVRFMSMTGG